MLLRDQVTHPPQAGPGTHRMPHRLGPVNPESPGAEDRSGRWARVPAGVPHTGHAGSMEPPPPTFEGLWSAPGAERPSVTAGMTEPLMKSI